MRHCFQVSLAVCLMALWLLLAGEAAAQEPPTPTPNAAGEIIIIVQTGDTLWNIAARAGLSLADLLALNGLTEDAIVVPGQPLVIGRVTLTPTLTPTPPPTATRPPPTPTQTPPPRPRTAVCLLAFTDLNGNGRGDGGESLRSGVAFTVYNQTAVIENYVTNGITEPHCLENLSPGEYHITRSMRPNETLTTEGDWTISLLAGEVVQVDFGSYAANDGAVTPTPAPTATAVPASTADDIAPAAGNSSPSLLTGLLILAGLIGAGMIFLAGWRKINQES